jgi:hypothetical protein
MSLLLNDNIKTKIRETALKQLVLKTAAISEENRTMSERHKGSCI